MACPRSPDVLTPHNCWFRGRSPQKNRSCNSRTGTFYFFKGGWASYLLAWPWIAGESNNKAMVFLSQRIIIDGSTISTFSSKFLSKINCSSDWPVLGALYQIMKTFFLCSKCFWFEFSVRSLRERHSCLFKKVFLRGLEWSLAPTWGDSRCWYRTEFDFLFLLVLC